MPFTKEKRKQYLAQKRKASTEQQEAARKSLVQKRKQKFLDEFPTFSDNCAALDPTELIVITRYYIEGYSLNQIGSALGNMSRQGVAWRRDQGLKKLKKILGIPLTG